MLRRLLYRLAIAAAVPFALLRLLWRGRRQPAYRRHWAERFALAPPTGAPGAVWIHAVSVGEMRAAEPLVKALRVTHPDLRVLLTCMTPTGRDTARQLFGDAMPVRYLPYDLAPAVRRFLRQHRPRLGILMETELWPELMSACAALDVPLYMVNARLSARSARRYRPVRGLLRDALRGVRGVAAQSAEDAERIRALGAVDVQVCGNLKFDRAPTPADLALAQDFRHRVGRRPVLLMASSRDGEEVLLLRAWRASATGDALLAIVPRHPQRFDDVAALVAQQGLPVQRRSDGEAVRAQTRVWLGDSMGELFAYYLACDVALIGGSFLDFGGQNLLEACAAGKPVLHGPHTYNFSEATRLADQAGAALCVAGMDDAVREGLQLTQDGVRRVRMGEAGQALMRAHQGATARVLSLLDL